MVNYSEELVRAATKLHQTLLLKGQVRRGNNLDVYESYSDPEVRTILHNILLPDTGAIIVQGDNVLYLVPEVDNNELSYSNKRMREIMKLKDNKELYMAQFILINVMAKFYSEQFILTNEPRSFVDIGEVIMDVRDFIEGFKRESDESIQDLSEEYEMNISSLIEVWDGLKDETEEIKDVRRAYTRYYGFLNKVLNLWINEGLITISKDEEINLTDKMKSITGTYYNQTERINKIKDLLENTEMERYKNA